MTPRRQRHALLIMIIHSFQHLDQDQVLLLDPVKLLVDLHLQYLDLLMQP
ncbi:hypothetical protein OESDEN_20590 [Oesophagostomum dentatum]|uniref:Uncharacterized protein n=1 Tax=Oesophagostomum dentatum TaxID=61180 RepID=A0A0B1S492_OESDE|nr:hypothetical protein OESDEN_20590 [Oesophagostomum dentatum]